MLLVQCYVLYICDTSTHFSLSWYQLLTLWSRVFLDKPVILQLLMMFIRIFVQSTDSSQRLQQPAACSYLELHQSSPCPHITSWRSIVILSSHLHPGLPHGLFLSGYPTKTLYASLLSRHSCHTARPFHSGRCDHLSNVRWAVYNLKLLSL